MESLNFVVQTHLFSVPEGVKVAHSVIGVLQSNPPVAVRIAPLFRGKIYFQLLGCSVHQELLEHCSCAWRLYSVSQ